MSATASETPQQRGHRMLKDAGYRAEGGKVTMARVKRVTRRAITEHEDEEHGGKHGRIKLKSGGAVEGHKPKMRPDRHRRDVGGQLPGAPGMGAAPMPSAAPAAGQQPTPQQIQMMRARMAQQGGMPAQQPVTARRGGTIKAGEFDMKRHDDGKGANRAKPVRPEKERARGGAADEFDTKSVSDAWEDREKTEDVDNERSRGGRAHRAEGGYVDIHREHDDMKIDHRAPGGMLGAPMGRPHMPKMGGGGKGKGGAKTINVIVGHGDDGADKMQMAHQAGMQQGMQLGAARGAAPPPAPPRPPMGPMAPPPSGAGMAGAPGMMGGPRPPMPGGMPLGVKRGGAIARAEGGAVKVRAHERRRAMGDCE